MEITLEDGKRLIKFARKNIEYYLENDRRMTVPVDLIEKYSQKSGGFVTLQKRSSDSQLKLLRGCIGMILPVYPLIQTISDMSLAAAMEDPRFPSVKKEEIDQILIEISVLTIPKVIEVNNPEEYLEKIKIGRDGLIIEKGMRRGLLLPQVPVDNNRNWDVPTFLEHLCMKAFLPNEAWKEENTKISSFQAIIFEEESPNGEIKRKKN
ncbi:MAG: TIGR00296 family protein [archaeon]|nr:TIGR00296 family protein [archaeon]